MVSSAVASAGSALPRGDNNLQSNSGPAATASSSKPDQDLAPCADEKDSWAEIIGSGAEGRIPGVALEAAAGNRLSTAIAVCEGLIDIYRKLEKKFDLTEQRNGEEMVDSLSILDEKEQGPTDTMEADHMIEKEDSWEDLQDSGSSEDGYHSDWDGSYDGYWA